MGRITIAVYRPKPGKEEELLKVIKDHMPVLKKQGLITDRKAIVMRAANGPVIEVFEWASEKAIADAHEIPEVLKLWDRFNEVCDYEVPANMEEFHKIFPDFTPLD